MGKTTKKDEMAALELIASPISLTYLVLTVGTTPSLDINKHRLFLVSPCH